MGYTGFSLKNFLAPFAAWTFQPPAELVALPCERQTCSSAELNLVSDFAQLIVAPAVPFRAPPSKKQDASIDASTHRLFVLGVKGSKAPLGIAPALILHGTDGLLTAEADAIHRGERLIGWGD